MVFSVAVPTRVETGSGHPGYLGQPRHVLPGSSGSDLVYKYPGLIRILHWIMCVKVMN